jgi:hypothetical protein
MALWSCEAICFSLVCTLDSSYDFSLIHAGRRWIVARRTSSVAPVRGVAGLLFVKPQYCYFRRKRRKLHLSVHYCRSQKSTRPLPTARGRLWWHSTRLSMLRSFRESESEGQKRKKGSEPFRPSVRRLALRRMCVKNSIQNKPLN